MPRAADRETLRRTQMVVNGALVDPPEVAADPSAAPALAEPSLAPRLTGSGGGPRFEFGGVLGVGATGEVYAVVDRDLQRPIAVKILKRSAKPGDDDLLGLLEEARVTASLQHPHVLPVHDLGVDEAGRPCFSMSRIDGVTLGEVIARSTPEARDAKIATANAIVTILIAVGQAIAYAHNRGLVHQDIKPDNILLGDFGEVLLLDWGAAAHVGADGRSVSRLYGTPLYMSPEQARQEYSDARSDVYGLGATLFHVLTLREPTWADDQDVFWAKKRSGVVDPLDAAARARCQPELLSIAETALAADPGHRYASVAAMTLDLERYQAGLAVSVHREPLWRVLLRWYRANRRAFWTAAAACVLLAGMALAMGVEKAKERSSWIELPRVNFTRDLRADWAGVTKDWSWPTPQPLPVEDAAYTPEPGGIQLRAASNGYTDLVHDRPVLGDLRVEWDYTSLSDGANLNCFIEGKDREAGYTFHAGGFDDRASVVLTKAGTILQKRPIVALEPRRSYHFRMEREADRLLLAIDGVVVLEYRDLDTADIPDDGRFGFDCTHVLGNRISGLRIWHKPLAQRISPIAFARKLLEMQRYPQAYEQFQDILAAYPRSTLAPEALYGMIVSQCRLGRTAEAGRLISRFGEDYPNHELMPYCLRERISLASAADDESDRQAALDALAQFPGHPVLASVASRLTADEIARSCRGRFPHGLDEDAFPADAAERIARSAAKLRRWLPAIGVSFAETGFSREGASALRWLGRPELVPELFPEDRVVCAEALVVAGRFDEVLARYRDVGSAGIEALVDLGRYEEVVTDTRAILVWRLRALLVRKQIDRALALFPNNAELLFSLGRYDEAMALAPSDQDLRSRCLLELGRLDEALPLTRTAWRRGRILALMGRYDDAMREFPENDCLPYECARFMILRDPATRERGRELLRKLCRAQANLDNEIVVFVRCFMPMLVANSLGEAVDPARDLADVLDHGRFWLGQRPWYLAAYLVGRIGEEEFLRQPIQGQIQARLHLARGLKAELAHDWPRAIEEFDASRDASPGCKVGLCESEGDYIVWRAKQLRAGR